MSHHENVKHNFKCEVCGEAFMVDSDLSDHLSSKHVSPSLDEATQCDQCGLTVSSHKELTEHKEKEHVVNDRSIHSSRNGSLSV